MLANIIHFAKNITYSLLAILLCFGALDLVWFTLIAGDWYRSNLSPLLREDFVIWPWAVFYLIYGGVIFVLAVVANREKPLYYAGIDGALLGLASYGAYNLTNYSVLDGFTVSVALVDWGWGICLSSASAMAGWKGFQHARREG